ncbi:1368_t:CDS:2 [Ambispora leptoticha]|uniref:1368_t:CDS:1 n=1 Tax=Ambispora leptoticha TaxID=144679 RepID=A0A9N9FLE9_9GLOM|nr:1368_t:CDS:2 [Ambispora leptoticha]
MSSLKKQQQIYKQQSQTSGGKFGPKMNLVVDNGDFEKKREPYMIRKVLKSTYFEKYEPSKTFIKAAIGIAKITNYFTSQSSIPSQSETIDLQFTDNSSESETENWLQIRAQNFKATPAKFKEFVEQELLVDIEITR